MDKVSQKAYLDKYDIMARYNCGVSKAISIIRCIHHVCGGDGALGKGKVLPAELEYWEANRGVNQYLNLNEGLNEVKAASFQDINKYLPYESRKIRRSVCVPYERKG